MNKTIKDYEVLDQKGYFKVLGIEAMFIGRF